MDLNCGNSVIAKQMIRCELPQGRKTELFVNVWDPWETIWNIENPKKPLVGTMCLYQYLDHIVQINTSHEALAEQRDSFCNLVYLRVIEKNLQGMPLKKDQDTMNRYQREPRFNDNREEKHCTHSNERQQAIE